MDRRAKSSSRTWAAVAGLAALALAVVYASLAPPPDSILRETKPSTFFSNDTGAKGGYLVLRELFGEQVRRWRHAPSLLNLLDGPDTVASLIVMGPSAPLTPKQAEALDAWMTDGGQLIVATSRPWPVREPSRPFQSRTGAESGTDAEEAEEPGSGEDEAPAGEAAPDAESEDYLARHGFQILTAENGVDDDAPLHVGEGRLREGGHTVLAAAGESALAGSLEVGEGRLVVVPDALAFSNRRLRRHPRNMTFLVRLLEDAPLSGGIAIDEYYHGFAGGRPFTAVLGGFALSAWGLASLQLAAAGLLYLLGTRRRFGGVQEPPPPPVRDPLALVEARAGLLQAAEARRLAVELIDRHRQRKRPAILAGAAATPAPNAEYQRILEQARGGGQLRDADLPVFARIAEQPDGRQI